MQKERFAICCYVLLLRKFVFPFTLFIWINKIRPILVRQYDNDNTDRGGKQRRTRGGVRVFCYKDGSNFTFSPGILT